MDHLYDKDVVLKFLDAQIEVEEEEMKALQFRLVNLSKAISTTSEMLMNLTALREEINCGRKEISSDRDA